MLALPKASWPLVAGSTFEMITQVTNEIKRMTIREKALIFLTIFDTIFSIVSFHAKCLLLTKHNYRQSGCIEHSSLKRVNHMPRFKQADSQFVALYVNPPFFSACSFFMGKRRTTIWNQLIKATKKICCGKYVLLSTLLVNEWKLLVNESLALKKIKRGEPWFYLTTWRTFIATFT